MTFANPLPLWSVPLIVALATMIAWYGYRGFAGTPLRRSGLIALRLVILLLIVIFLARPVGRTIESDPTNALVPILIDTSRSMGIEDADNGSTRRIDHARRIVEQQLLPSLAGRFETEILGFGERTAVVETSKISATARRSDLAGALSALRERYRGRVIAGVVLISDGGDTSGAAEAAIERQRIAPIYAIGVGSRTVGRDREVLSVTAAEAVLDESRVDLAVSAVTHGHGVAPIELRLLENGRVVEVRRATPAADGTPVREIFHVSPGRGAPSVYTVEIPAATGELVPENNARSTLVQPPARARRVLMVEGAPGFEHSFLKRSLAADRGLEVDSVVKKGKNEQGADTYYVQAVQSRSNALMAGYPPNAEALFVYDALVLANVDADQLTRTQLEATRDLIARRGGGLLVLGAQSFLRRGLLDTSLEEVLPLELTDRASAVVPAAEVRSRNRVTLTAAGETHPIMQVAGSLEETRKRWDALPPLASIAPLGGPRAGASVLAITSGPGGAPRALISVQRYGEGRSMVFAGEAAWRWRMLLPAADRSYDTFWRQAVRWLAMGATDPIVVSTPAGGSAADTLPFRVAVRSRSFEPVADATVDVRITAPDGRVDQLRAAPEQGSAPDGRYVAQYQAEASGVYRVAAEAKRGAESLGGTTTSVLVGGADLEMTDPRLNAHVLQRVAYASGGRLLADTEIGTLAELLRSRLPTAILSVRHDLWNNIWSFAAILALLGAEWILRRRWGLR